MDRADFLPLYVPTADELRQEWPMLARVSERYAWREVARLHREIADLVSARVSRAEKG